MLTNLRNQKHRQPYANFKNTVCNSATTIYSDSLSKSSVNGKKKKQIILSKNTVQRFLSNTTFGRKQNKSKQKPKVSVGYNRTNFCHHILISHLLVVWEGVTYLILTNFLQKKILMLTEPFRMSKIIAKLYGV